MKQVARIIGMGTLILLLVASGFVIDGGTGQAMAKTDRPDKEEVRHSSVSPEVQRDPCVPPSPLLGSGHRPTPC
jgi:hypothetical protein